MSNKLIILILLVNTAFFSANLYSSDEENIKNRLDVIENNILEANKKKKNLIKSLKNIDKQIKETDIKISKIEKKIIVINKNKNILKFEISNIEKNIEGINHKKKNSNMILKKIIYENYSKNNSNFIYEILNSNSKDAFLSIEFSKFITNSQKNKTDLYQIDENIKLARLNEYNKKSDSLNNLNQDLKVKLDLLNQLEKKNRNLSSEVKKKIKNSEEVYFKYLNEQSDLITILNNLNSTNKNKDVLKAKGNLPWPVEGEVSNNFNKFKFKNLYKWDGEIILTSSSEYVRSIYSGEVVFSNWIKGYGLLIIIDHGENLMSLYAHNKVLLKKTGDKVIAGDIISKSGVSGGNDKNSIYFEIRKNGIPQNPHKWCNISNKFSLAE